MTDRSLSIIGLFGLIGFEVALLTSSLYAQSPIQHVVLSAGGDVAEFAVSADGQSVVFLSDDEVAGRFEIFSVPVVGGSATQLNDALVEGGDITHIRLSPDSVFVVYRADREVDERFDLYAVPLAGGTSIRLNPPMSGDVDPVFDITFGSGRVVYQGRDPDWFDHLVPHVVPITGGDSLVLNPFLPEGQDEGFVFRLSPLGHYVVFLSRGEPRLPLWSAAANGSSFIELDAPHPFFTHTYGWDFLSNDDGLIYEISDRLDRENAVLFSPLQGGATTTQTGGNPSAGFGFTSYDVALFNGIHYFLDA